jgi:4-methylaminobutanoate oxidase (formaldehyde-forming)
MLVGLFEPVGRPWPAAGPPPTDTPFISMEPDPDHLANWIGPAFDRIPILHETGVRLLFDGPESFTPDDAYILGEAPTVDRLFVAAGFNSIGIQSAGGAGMAIAHWITEGAPPFDLHDVDIRRFEPHQADESYLRERTVEVLGLLYAPHWPTRTFETARGVRLSPVHERLVGHGAAFADLNGWDRPMYFARPELGVGTDYDYSWGREAWHGANAVEHRAVRKRVGMFDLTSFAKFLVHGDDAADVLDVVSAGAVNGPVGRSVYTQWLNDDGGIEADLTVSRVGDDSFWVIGGAGTRTRDLTTLQRAVRGRRASVTDITDAHACLAVMGPESRSVLQSMTTADLGDEAFPFATNQHIDIGATEVLANRMSYVGELGWEVYVPALAAIEVFDAILEAGSAWGIELCGYHTLNSLRVEKGYRHWGHDITPDDTPVEAGLGFAVAWDKEASFVGRSAVERQKAEGASRRLVQVQLVQGDEPGAQLLHHHEPLYRNGQRVGYITSGMWGHTVGAAVGMGLAVRSARGSGERVTPDWVNDAEWAVELPGGLVPARAQLRPWL